MSATYIPIQSITLSTSATSVTFSNIPQTYTDLVLRVSARDTSEGTTGWIQGRFNTVNANYSETRLTGDGAAVASGRVGPQTVWGASGWIVSNTNGNTANSFGSFELYIPNYAGATNKPFSVTAVQESNSASTGVKITTHALLWSNSAAISSILVQSSGTFASGSTFHLYGISNT